MIRTPIDAREELVRIRAELLERLRAIRDDAARRRAPLSMDAPDRAQELENDEVLERLDRATVELLGEYRNAIERIDAGLYGTCERCGFEVGAQRLAAVPQATLCASCAALQKPRAA